MGGGEGGREEVGRDWSRREGRREGGRAREGWRGRKREGDARGGEEEKGNGHLSLAKRVYLLKGRVDIVNIPLE